MTWGSVFSITVPIGPFGSVAPPWKFALVVVALRRVCTEASNPSLPIASFGAALSRRFSTPFPEIWGTSSWGPCIKDPTI